MVQGVDEARVADMLLKKLDGIRRDLRPFAAPVAMPATPLRHFKEEIPGLTQAKLCMLFTTGEANPNPPSVSILRVAMSVLGGSATSRLFRNVREKQSLCYYIAVLLRPARHRRHDDRLRRRAGQGAAGRGRHHCRAGGPENGPITQEEGTTAAAVFVQHGRPRRQPGRVGKLVLRPDTRGEPPTRRSTARC